ncbi:MAG: DUF1559 domain-containing protein [Bacteroidales bacterium]|nr:DUF1559 domain-containing protein [Bacteroidales bacterium]
MASPIHVRAIRQRSAFTLIELLVVIAIIAILIGLLLPAVQKVREASARTKCQNNMKQIGLGLHGYHDSHGALPPATQGEPSGNIKPGAAPNGAWAWSTFILPFLEQSAIYNQLNPEKTTIPPTQPSTGTTGVQTPIPVYICPSNTPPKTNSNRGYHATSNYAAVLGPAPGTGTSFTFAQFSTNATGCMVANKTNTLLNITDGTSNTVAVGERFLGKVGTTTYNGGIWSGVYEDGRVAAIMWYLSGSTAAIHNDHRILADNGANPWGFASQHNGSANFTFADGSVRPVQSSVDRTIQVYLGSRNDGIPFTLD